MIVFKSPSDLHEKQLNKIAAYPYDWDTFGSSAPDENVIADAKEAIKILKKQKFKNIRIVPTGDNSIYLYFDANQNCTFIEVYGQKQFVVPSRYDDSKYFDVDLKQLKEYLNNDSFC